MLMERVLHKYAVVAATLDSQSRVGGETLTYLGENEILSQWTPLETPQHNSVSERRNQTLLDMVRSMMDFASLPISF